jgi:hypothetical protein
MSVRNGQMRSGDTGQRGHGLDVTPIGGRRAGRAPRLRPPGRTGVAGPATLDNACYVDREVKEP